MICFHLFSPFQLTYGAALSNIFQHFDRIQCELLKFKCTEQLEFDILIDEWRWSAGKKLQSSLSMEKGDPWIYALKKKTGFDLLSKYRAVVEMKTMANFLRHRWNWFIAECFAGVSYKDLDE